MSKHVENHRHHMNFVCYPDTADSFTYVDERIDALADHCVKELEKQGFKRFGCSKFLKPVFLCFARLK